jgi:hypothetical protein
MLRIAYIVVSLIALAPAAVIAALALIMVVHTATLPQESDRASAESLHFYTVSFGSLEVPIHPRAWAAVFVLFGSILWCVGIIFLLFIRT